MQTRQKELFTTIKSEGGILPLDYLRKVESFSKDIKGITSADYHLIEGEAILQKISRDWARAQTAWTSFKKAREKIAGDQAGTVETREKWLLPLFTILEYGRLEKASYIFEDKTYPISHAWRQIPIHFVGCGVSIDKKQKGAAGAINSSPYSTVQEFLNKSKDHLWGIVSNGLVLRLLRDNVSLTRQAYIEFDLEIMFDNEIYSDFKVLWLLCHQSRFEGENPAECIMEQWVQQARTQGTRMLEDLRNGVESAIAALGSGFIDHSSNTALRASLQNGTLDKQDFYRQLLRLVYRFIFLFTAEDRDVLFRTDVSFSQKEKYLQNYSTRRLRRLAGKIKGTTHEDLWESFRITMSILGSKGDTTLGLPALGSMLWSIDAIRDLHSSTIANSSLLDAVRALAYTVKNSVRLAVDYRNMGTEELGSVYEALLELHPDINTETGRFELKSASGNERKTTGSYYTPSSLINCLLDSALEPVLNEAAKQADPEKAILNLKICDPACGSGHFLIAAAHRMAKRLASIRTNEEEPPIEDVRHALRDIISRCIYGVDINPMSVELCKVSLWMEAMEPGKPLSFVDHHIRCGNSLLGTTPALIAKGIPEAAFEPIEGDDKKICIVAKKRNKKEREGQQLSMLHQLTAQVVKLGNLTQSMVKLDDMNDDSIDAIDQKQRKYQELINSQDYLFNHLLADSWCSAFVMKKDDPNKLLITHDVFKRIEANPFWTPPTLKQEILELRDQYQFFHWHLEFPDVFRVPGNNELPENEQCGWRGGFNCVLGNPPWERIKIQEKEWFAKKIPEIADAQNAALRKKMIEELKINELSIYYSFLFDMRRAECESNFVRSSRRFPLCGRGDVNTYALFAELNKDLIDKNGFVGCIVPSGVATDKTTSLFFRNIVKNSSLVSLYDFWEIRRFFLDTDSRNPFCLLTLKFPDPFHSGFADFVFDIHSLSELADSERHYQLSPADISLINPNTMTSPIFRKKIDAEIIKKIYTQVPVLLKENTTENPWDIDFFSMFHMSNDSGLFETYDQIIKKGYYPYFNSFKINNQIKYLPLFEAKMIYLYDHRYNTYSNEEIIEVKEECKKDVNYSALPKSWLPIDIVQERIPKHWKHNWFIGWRGITNSDSERTIIATILPKTAVGNSIPICLTNRTSIENICLVANVSSIPFDFVARSKVGGNNLNFFIIYQLPAFDPEFYEMECEWDLQTTLRQWIFKRAFELIYTAEDLKDFAQDCNCYNAPFIWNENRRFLLKCELDAAFFHLYRISPKEVEYILDTFNLIKDKDIEKYQYYRTKEQILEIYNELLRCKINKVSYKSNLNPSPSDIRCTHGYQQQSYEPISINAPQGFPREGREWFVLSTIPYLIQSKPGQPFKYYLVAALLLSDPEGCASIILSEDDRQEFRRLSDFHAPQTGTPRYPEIYNRLLTDGMFKTEEVSDSSGLWPEGLPTLDHKTQALIPFGIKAADAFFADRQRRIDTLRTLENSKEIALELQNIGVLV